MSQKLNGGTTVSATMLLAHLAGIPIMATGGIGGVHRGAELIFDISNDLIELGRTPVAVVCSGVKSILDIGKTLEYLVSICFYITNKFYYVKGFIQLYFLVGNSWSSCNSYW